MKLDKLANELKKRQHRLQRMRRKSRKARKAIAKLPMAFINGMDNEDVVWSYLTCSICHAELATNLPSVLNDVRNCQQFVMRCDHLRRLHDIECHNEHIPAFLTIAHFGTDEIVEYMTAALQTDGVKSGGQVLNYAVFPREHFDSPDDMAREVVKLAVAWRATDVRCFDELLHPAFDNDGNPRIQVFD